jgi:hypothetical protein
MENSLWKKLWTCRETDYVVVVVVVIRTIAMMAVATLMVQCSTDFSCNFN